MERIVIEQVTRMFFLFLAFVLNVNNSCLAKTTLSQNFKSSNCDDTLKNTDDLRIKLIKVLGGHINLDTLSQLPKNSAFVFSLGLSVDRGGKIEHIYFSENLAKMTSFVITPSDELVNSLKKILILDTKYRNKILIFPSCLKGQKILKLIT